MSAWPRRVAWWGIVAVLLSANLLLVWQARRARNAFPPREALSLDGAWQGADGAVSVPQVVGSSGRSFLQCHRAVFVPPSWRGRGRVLLHFERASHWLRVSWDGQPVGEHHGSRTSAVFDVTPYVRYGASSELDVRLETAWTGHPWPGVSSEDVSVVSAYVTDRLRSRVAALSGPVWLGLEPQIALQAPLITTSFRERRLTVEVPVHNHGALPTRLRLAARVTGEGNVPVLSPQAVEVPAAGQAVNARFEARWSSAVPWGPGDARRYTLELRLLDGEREVDATTTRFGFRELWMEGGRLMMNGASLFIMALQVDPTQYPWLEEATARQAIQVLKRRGFNALESHYEPPLAPFYDAADEEGMLVVSSAICLGRMSENGRLPLPPAAIDALARTSGEWFRDEQRHPCIVMWNQCTLIGALREQVYARMDAVDPTRLAPGRGFQSVVVNMRPDALPTTPREPVFIAEFYPAAGAARFIEQFRSQSGSIGMVLCGRSDRWTRGADGAPQVDVSDIR